MALSSMETQDEVGPQFRRLSISQLLPVSDSKHSAFPQGTGTNDSKLPGITFDIFATELRLHTIQESRLKILKQQQRTLQRALALSARLSRTLDHVQAGLVQTLKMGDKAGFASAYHATVDLKDGCSSLWNRGIKHFDPVGEDSTSSSIREPDSLTFMNQLPSGSQADILDFIHLLRTNSSFLVDRIRRLNPSQLSGLASCPKMHIPKDSIFSSVARGASQASQQKRQTAFSSSLKDTGWSLERTTPVSTLLFNVYSALPTHDLGDDLIRLDVWSSTCADLYSHSDQAYHYLLTEVLNAFSSLHVWRAKPRIDLFLMNLLQTGAFLLEPVEDHVTSNDYPLPVSDPLRTEEAEVFFDNAVQELFGLLNDGDGGFPFGALHFGSAILGKLSQPERQSSFRGFLLYSWYFGNFLFSALTMPEAKGMLLHYHVSNSARERILKEVATRAQSRVAEFLDPTSNPTPLLPVIRAQLEQIVSCLIEIKVNGSTHNTLDPGVNRSSLAAAILHPGRLTLSISDILLLIDMLVPQPPASFTPWDPDPFLNSSATAFAAQYRQGSPQLSKIFPSDLQPSSGIAQNSLPMSQSSATALVRKFDQVRRDLHAVMDRNALYPLPHPTLDLWTILDFDDQGYPVIGGSPGQGRDSSSTSHASTSSSSKDEHFSPNVYHNLDTVQRASLRLVDQRGNLMHTPKFNTGSDGVSVRSISLERLFTAELEGAEANADSRKTRYWWAALKALRAQYPLCVLAQNDTRILQPVLSRSRHHNSIIQHEIQMVEVGLRYLEDAFDKLSATISDILGRLDKLRGKMWYMAEVTNSSIYEVTRNVAQALRNMASPSSILGPSSSASIRGRKKPRSLAESIMQEPEAQTMSIMKAPLEQGGPKKLADEQVDMTKRWFQRFGVDNFCKGEERIHRFCMEIRIAASKLVGDSMIESPVLFSSELYFRQRTFMDGLVTRSMPTSVVTRPSSILSEEGQSTYTQAYQGLRGSESASRPQPFDSQSSPGRKSSFHSLGSDRWRPVKEFYSSDLLLSVTDSPGRAVSATTADSTNSFWSPHPTQPQSAASVSSLHSRPSSFVNDASSPKLTVDQNSPRRIKFLEELRQRIISLLLSDLGSPVWSCGSETDTWLADMLRQKPVRWQLQKRRGMEILLGSDETPSSLYVNDGPIKKTMLNARRSTSAAPFTAGVTKAGLDPFTLSDDGAAELRESMGIEAPPDAFPYQTAYEDLMNRFSRQADPMLKLEILHDLKCLVMSSIQEKPEQGSPLGNESRQSMLSAQRSVRSVPSSRRSSLDPTTFTMSTRSSTMFADVAGPPRPSDSATNDKAIVDEIKMVLMSTRPKTLFRDLQFITAFVPPDILNKTPGGKAFLQVGIAALAFKDDVCRSLVSAADKILVDDSVKRKAPPRGSINYSLRDAAQMWILAAKEGNATAQRELAILYLSSPELLPSVTLPLTAPRDIFKSEMKYWRGDGSKRLSSQAMCLALHWMQLAASNGDFIAKKRLEEREATELNR